MDNKEKDHSNHKLPCLQNFRLLSIIAVSLWGIAWFFLWCVFSSSVTDCANIVEPDTSWISAGTFGDMFGCLTCLFTGISVAGVIVTLQQQKQSLHVQQNELDILKSQSKKQNQLNEKAYILKLIEGYISYREKTTITVQTLDIQGKYFREELRHASFAERFCNIQSRLLNLLGQYVENKISKNEVEECYAAHQLLLEGTIQHRLQLLFLLGTSNKSINSLIQVPKLFFETRRRPKLMVGRLFCSTLPLKYRFGAFFYAVFPLFPHFRTQ